MIGFLSPNSYRFFVLELEKQWARSNAKKLNDFIFTPRCLRKDQR